VHGLTLTSFISVTVTHFTGHREFLGIATLIIEAEDSRCTVAHSSPKLDLQIHYKLALHGTLWRLAKKKSFTEKKVQHVTNNVMHDLYDKLMRKSSNRFLFAVSQEKIVHKKISSTLVN